MLAWLWEQLVGQQQGQLVPAAAPAAVPAAAPSLQQEVRQGEGWWLVQGGACFGAAVRSSLHVPEVPPAACVPMGVLLQVAAHFPCAAEDGVSPLPAFCSWVARQEAAGKLAFEVKGETESAWLLTAAAAPTPEGVAALSAPVGEEEGCGTQPATLALR